MFDVGYSEILVIAIVLIVVVGPKDLPKMLRAFGKMMTKFRSVSGEFRRQFDDALKEAELDEVRKTITGIKSLDPRTQLRDALNPLRDAGQSLRSELNKPVIPQRQAPAAPVQLPPEQPDAPAKLAPKARKAVTPEKTGAKSSTKAKPGAAKSVKASPAQSVAAVPAASVAARPSAKAKTSKPAEKPAAKMAVKSTTKPQPKAAAASAAKKPVKAK